MRSATLGTVAVLLVTSCYADWREDYDFAWQGERVTVYGYGHTEADLCGGSLAELDGHTAAIERELGIEGAPAYPYRWLSADYWDALGETNPCHEHAACASSGEPITRWLPHMHEVVHAITHDAGGCPRLLDEGLAMYYDGSSPTTLGSVAENPTQIRELLANGLLGHTYGDRIGRLLHFTTFLVETYGPPSVLELCGELPMLEPSLAEWDQAVLEVYEITLEQLLDEYDAFPECRYANMAGRLWGCSGRRDFTFWNPDGEYVVETGCDEPQVTNAWGEAVLTRRVYLFTDMELRVSSNTVGTGRDAVHALQRCPSSCSDDPEVYVEISDDPYDYETRLYPAGLYEVTVEFDPSSNVRLSIEASEPLD
jgi:hypothetical protein